MPGTRPIAMQRAAPLMPLVPLLAELGTSLEAVLKGTGVSLDQVSQDGFIPYVAFGAILDNACRLTGRKDIGLLLGQRLTLSLLGPLGEVMRHAATLGEALATFCALQIHNSTGAAVYLIRMNRNAILGYGVYVEAEPASPLIYDAVLAAGCRLIAELTAGGVSPEELLVSRAAPDDPAPYHQLAPCPIRFGQAQTAMLLPGAALDFTMPDADVARAGAALAGFAEAASATTGDMTGQARHALRPLLLSGKGGMANVAARLGLHPRTLRRRLVQEGTTFEAIKDEVRYTVARELLLVGALSITDIARTLDFAGTGAFVHAFRRWSGKPPGQWRKDRAAGPRP